jgi:hypothetical protein
MDLDDGMGFVRATMSLILMFAVIAAGTEAAHADERLSNCGATSAQHAHALADEARHNGEYRRAAQCYRQAGEPVAADRALARAFAETGAASTKKASATIDDAKAQARRIREAFRPKPVARRS